MQLSDADYQLVKDRAIELWLLVKYNPYQDEDRSLSKCYTEAVVELLKRKGLLKED